MLVVPHRLFDRWTILILCGVGAFMFWGAGHYSVFDDEGFSCRRYTMPLGEMVTALWHGEEPDPPLYYILQNTWVHSFGVGPLGLRSLSILMLLAGLIFTRLAATEWYDAPTGRLAMLIAAIHPAHLLFGFAGRWYSTMFCLVALLVWMTGRLAQWGDWRVIIAWSLSAAAVCFTNYFGVVIVGFLLIVFLIGHPHRMRWVKAAIGVFAIYAIWIPAFWRQATSFPQPAITSSEFAASALRLLGALATGNLASTSAWWVWVAFLVFLLLSLLLLKIRGQRSWPHPLGMVVCLSLTAGVVTQTLIDKYIMTISGPLIVVAAAGWLSTWRADERPWIRRCLRLAAVSLALAWVGCYVNLVTERNWSSLRWLDPWERALAELEGKVAATQCVVSQPAARYYYGVMMARHVEPKGWIQPDLWRRFAMPPGTKSSADGAATPESIFEGLKFLPPRLATIRGAEFADSPEWTRLQAILDREYRVAEERTYLRDPDAKWKDRLDPTFKHPEWRINVRVYERRLDSEPIACTAGS
jgi:4-amino-4-deoxy-L-arabinose transferase-like glycosyltransferase